MSNRTVELARLGVSLRWRLVSNRAKRMGKKSQRFAYVLSGLYALGNIVGLAASRFIGDVSSTRTLVLLVSSLASGWIFGPILIGGVDETVDPTRMALLPLKQSELFTVQLAAALSGVGPLAALVSLSIGIPLGFAPLGIGALVVLLAPVLTVVMIVGIARAVAACLTIAQRSRAGRDLAVLAAALMAGTLFVVAQLATSFSEARAAAIIDSLLWAPWAWPARAVLLVRDGNALAGFGWLAAAALAATGALALWSRLSLFLLHNGERVVSVGRRGQGAALSGATTTFGGALARQWIYLRRSPNTRVALLFGIAFGVAFPVLQIFQHGAGDSPAAAFGVLLAMLANVGATSNLLGFDAGSLWLEVLCGGPARTHMVARSLIVLPNLLLPTWLSSIVVGVWTDQWRYVAVVALIAIPIALIVLAQGLVTSILAPWPLPDGDNPFGNRQASEGRGSKLAVTALSGLFGGIIASSPIMLAAFVGRDAGWVWWVPALGMLWAGAIAGAVVYWLGNNLAGREPELVEVLSPLAVN